MIAAAPISAPRWRGQSGRLEVWYATLTEPATGTGFWVHAETLAPLAGRGEPEAHGWIAVFPPGAPAYFERFGPAPAGTAHDAAGFDAAGACIDGSRVRASTATISCDLTYDDAAPALWTFPRWAWERQALPAAQVVSAPSAVFRGIVRTAAREWELDSARGGVARIYGHGNAHRWGWLHADLGGGDVLEVVAAQARRPAMRRLGVRTFAQLRIDDRDLIRDPLLAAMSPRLHTTLAQPEWRVRGKAFGVDLDVRVTIPPEHAVAIPYRDPDGEGPICTNSCVASADVVVRSKATGERHFHLDGTAHAEIGTRA